MAENSAIEWTDATWQIVTGCSLASPGCTNCYAMKLAGTRLRRHPSRAGLTIETKAGPIWNGAVRFNEEWLLQPLQWRRPRNIFVAAHGDLFHPDVPDQVLDKVFAVMALAPRHTFQVLTKRSARMRAYLSDPGMPVRVMLAAGFIAYEGESGMLQVDVPKARALFPLRNVWLGVSAEDQRRADERVPDLLDTPAAVRFVSAEPLLGPIDFTKISLGRKPGIVLGESRKQDRPETFLVYRDALMDTDGAMERLDWIIVGGESGPGARPMHPAWARSIRDQCEAAGVAFHFKQHGAWADVGPHPRGEFISSDPQMDPIHCGDPIFMAPVGKKAAGRLLDGVEHNGMPAEGRAP